MNSTEHFAMLHALTYAAMGSNFSAPRHLARDERGKVGTNRPKKKKKFGKKKK
jgi:hypothetical protein